MYLEDIFLTGVSLAGLPAISIPSGFSNDLPFGLQIIADKFKEDLLLRVAHNFQKETSWHQKLPDLK
jgi:aspartyl-tRNA(Asn)/glutamyl-tRNA(Gln) amidotransferase subunit A